MRHCRPESLLNSCEVTLPARAVIWSLITTARRSRPTTESRVVLVAPSSALIDPHKRQRCSQCGGVARDKEAEAQRDRSSSMHSQSAASSRRRSHQSMATRSSPSSSDGTPPGRCLRRARRGDAFCRGVPRAPPRPVAVVPLKRSCGRRTSRCRMPRRRRSASRRTQRVKDVQRAAPRSTSTWSSRCRPRARVQHLPSAPTSSDVASRPMDRSSIGGRRRRRPWSLAAACAVVVRVLALVIEEIAKAGARRAAAAATRRAPDAARVGSSAGSRHQDTAGQGISDDSWVYGRFETAALQRIRCTGRGAHARSCG